MTRKDKEQYQVFRNLPQTKTMIKSLQELDSTMSKVYQIVIEKDAEISKLQDTIIDLQNQIKDLLRNQNNEAN